MNRIKQISLSASMFLAVLIFSCSTSGNDVESGYEQKAGNLSSSSGNVSSSSIFVNLADTTFITLKGTSAEIVGKDAVAVQNSNYGTIVEITGSRVYSVQGQLSNGFIAVAQKDINPIVILNGVDIASSNYAPIVSLKKSNVTLVLASGTTNTISDGGQGATDGKYNLGYDIEEQPNATLLVRRNLTIKGIGKLIVNSKLNNGIGSRAILRIESGDIKVDAPNNALKGNDEVVITGGTLNLTSKEDGIKTEGEEGDSSLGAISITGGDITINSVQDGIQAATDLNISGATLKITAGGGSNGSARGTNDPSSKGIKSVKNIHIKSGNINIDSKDDGIHADEGLIIDGGTITVATNNSMGSGGTGGFPGWGGGTTSANGGDGLRGAKSVIINDGNIDITKAYEGIEGFKITINGGTIRIKSSDDGINVSDYVDSPANGCSANAICCVINSNLTINGGTIYVDAGTDGLDSNGDIIINGGTIVVFGSGTSNLEEAIDADKDIIVNGGTLIALGEDSQCMQHAPKESSRQRSIFVKRSSAVAANTIVNVTSGGNQVVAFRTLRNATRMLITSPQINTGTLEIRTGGSHSGTENNMRMFTGGSYNTSGSTQLVSFNVNGMVTTSNNSSCNSPRTFTCDTSTSR